MKAEIKIEVKFGKVTDTSKADILLMRFKEYANSQKVGYRVNRTVSFNFKKFKWMIKDIVTFRGNNEATVEFVTDQYIKVIATI